MPATPPFDPYHRWLGIPAKDQPPNHYRLLGVELFERDAEVIALAADERMLHLKTFQAGPASGLSQRLLNEVAAARVCLLNSERKAAYDEQLRAELRQRHPADLRAPPVPPFNVAAGYYPTPMRPISADPVPIIPPQANPAKSGVSPSMAVPGASSNAYTGSRDSGFERPSRGKQRELATSHRSRIPAIAIGSFGMILILGLSVNLWQRLSVKGESSSPGNRSNGRPYVAETPSSSNVFSTLAARGALPPDSPEFGLLPAETDSRLEFVHETLVRQGNRFPPLPTLEPDRLMLTASRGRSGLVGWRGYATTASEQGEERDSLRTGSIWKGDFVQSLGVERRDFSDQCRLKISSRDGESIAGAALLIKSGRYLELRGTVLGGDIIWTDQKTNDIYSGKLAGNKMDLRFSGRRGVDNSPTAGFVKLIRDDQSWHHAAAAIKLLQPADVGFQGLGGAGSAFDGRRTSVRSAMLLNGGTKQSERAVAAALNWLARHQSANGSWSLNNFQQNCKGSPCSGRATITADWAATALGVLPFLAAGCAQTLEGPYRSHVSNAINWLVSHQASDGRLSAPELSMYSHALATTALCEDYGVTKLPQVGSAAQSAIKYIERAQNRTTGGWRYQPGDEGDLSVLGWQVTALKSAQMAGLAVDPAVFDGARRYLGTVKKNPSATMFAYDPGQQPTPTMSAVGLLCSQYLSAAGQPPSMDEAKAYLLRNAPSMQSHNVYYWYYATQVMHNLQGAEWDAWNRQMRKLLIESQTTQGCAAGSWAPDSPTKDTWSEQGGRIMMTSLSCLTLEVYYRHVPLYKFNGDPRK